MNIELDEKQYHQAKFFNPIEKNKRRTKQQARSEHGAKFNFIVNHHEMSNYPKAHFRVLSRVGETGLEDYL